MVVKFCQESFMYIFPNFSPEIILAMIVKEMEVVIFFNFLFVYFFKCIHVNRVWWNHKKKVIKVLYLDQLVLWIKYTKYPFGRPRSRVQPRVPIICAGLIRPKPWTPISPWKLTCQPKDCIEKP
jgi:hypothetical protein